MSTSASEGGGRRGQSLRASRASRGRAHCAAGARPRCRSERCASETNAPSMLSSPNSSLERPVRDRRDRSVSGAGTRGPAHPARRARPQRRRRREPDPSANRAPCGNPANGGSRTSDSRSRFSFLRALLPGRDRSREQPDERARLRRFVGEDGEMLEVVADHVRKRTGRTSPLAALTNRGRRGAGARRASGNVRERRRGIRQSSSTARATIHCACSFSCTAFCRKPQIERRESRRGRAAGPG